MTATTLELLEWGLRYGEPPQTPANEPTSEKGKEFKNEILILVSAPLLKEDLSSLENLSIQTEIDEIVSVIENIPSRINVEITVKIATTESLLEVFSNQFKPLIIHFIGHGMNSSQSTALILEDRVGIARPFTERDLSILLADRTEVPCQLAILNACHSEVFANALIESGVPHVIAVKAEDTILDKAARCFARHFYQALFNNISILNGFEQSRNAVKINDDLLKIFNSKTFEQGVNLEEAIKFQLLPRNSLEHHQTLKLQSSTSGQVIAPTWKNNNIPSNDPTFVGRRIDLHRLAQILGNTEGEHCILLHGMGGMGKTALAYAIGRWQHERERWRDGVWFVKLRDVDSVANAIAKIRQTLVMEGVINSKTSLAQCLKNKNLLLILDDLDKLIEQEEDELIELLNSLLSCRQLRLLVTSRQDLSHATLFHRRHDIFEMGESETKKIFRKYAPLQENWGQDDSTLKDFDSLIKFLDGYPLAIRLAASYMKRTRCSLKMLHERLQDAPLKVLKPIDRREHRNNSLHATLELSYKALPPGAKELFPIFALFPGGLTDELASHVWGETSFESLAVLLEFSMAEKALNNKSSTWRVTLPEPARSYAESKQKRGRKDIAPLVLEYYYSVFTAKILTLDENNQTQQLEQILLEENSNLRIFLQWGYEREKSQKQVCYSARTTALLSPFWQWIEPGKDPLLSLNLCLLVAARNQDLWGQAEIKKASADIQLRKKGLKEEVRLMYSEAIDLYESELAKVEDDNTKALIQCRIGAIYNSVQETELAISSYLNAVKFYVLSGKIIEAADTKIIIGEIQEVIQDLDSALAIYQEAKELYQEQENESKIAKVENLIARVRRKIELDEKGLGTFNFTTIKVSERGEIIREEKYTVPYYSVAILDRVSLDMVYIPGGKFIMGSPEDEAYDHEKPQHEVTVQLFFMGKYPITQAQWKAIASREDLKVERDLDPNPAYFKDYEGSHRRPVEQVSWYDAVEFCQRLSQKTGTEYRLPTEAEWEYACRAGTTTSYYFGETITAKLANYNTTGTTPVGQFPPNAFGLYDMHGNVWEWCQDDWHGSYQDAPTDGRAWVSEESSYKVIRGASWLNVPDNCRSAIRNGSSYGDRYDHVGFRVVCVPPETT